MTYRSGQRSYDSLEKKLESIGQGDAPVYIARNSATIITTSDSLFRILTMHQSILDRRTSGLALLGIGITLVGTLTTTTQFKKLLGISPDVWNAIFSVSLALCILLIVAVGFSLRNHWGVLWQGDTVNFIINKIKDDSEEWLRTNRDQEGDARSKLADALYSAWSSGKYNLVPLDREEKEQK